MKPKEKKDNLIHTALNLLVHNIHWKIDARIQPVRMKGAEGPEALIRLKWEKGGCILAVHVKPFFARSMIAEAARKLKAFPEKGVLVTKYVPPQLADDLKAMDIPFLDTAGNAYVNIPPVYLFIKGNKPQDAPEREPTIRAFQHMGLQVIFALLWNPELITMPFRRIAMDAGIALGTVGYVMKDLQRMGFLIETGEKGRFLVNKRKLLDRWITGYAEKLRPKILLGRYQAQNPDWWKDQLDAYPNVFWGGEVAAEKLTQHLKPQIMTLYTNNTKNLGTIILKNRLIKNNQGDVEILKVFWKDKHDRQDLHLVPPILIYADLVATGDKRNLETAEILYEKEIARFIEED